MKMLIASSIVMALLVSTRTSAQDRIISGTVVSADDGSAIPGVNVTVKGTTTGTTTDHSGHYSLTVPPSAKKIVFSFIGYVTTEVPLSVNNTVNVSLTMDVQQLSEIVTGYGSKPLQSKIGPSKRKDSAKSAAGFFAGEMYEQDFQQPAYNTEEYDAIRENGFRDALRAPFSTFSIDVDAASYANVRRFINNAQRPPIDAVRIEEMVNYFDYDYEQPTGEDPFSIYTEVSTAPWNAKHQLVHIGLQGKKIPADNLPASNLVFLIDVSGSMDEPNKLPLLKASFKLLIEQLREQDKVSIVVYAGAAGLVLPPTPGSDKQRILEALNNLSAGGSTAGGAGIQLAYAIAKENFKAGGNNRVILATDGDFNVGESSNASMERLIEEKRKDGVFLTVLGFGMGNYKDSKMVTLSNKGNGNYAYIDNILEAQKVLVNEFGGTLFTIAKDVKLQVEFNPAKVQAYRLIGYEDRLLKDEDFNNDKKDAGDLGSGHTVTALYEIIPVGTDSEFFKIDAPKYQSSQITRAAGKSDELMTVKFRYKQPDGDVSKLIIHTQKDNTVELNKTSENFKWSAAVAAFGMLLRNSEYAKGYAYENVLQLAEQTRGKDPHGYRIEFINMVKSQGLLASR
jgi:Ca-activated chloride channel family protein